MPPETSTDEQPKIEQPKDKAKTDKAKTEAKPLEGALLQAQQESPAERRERLAVALLSGMLANPALTNTVGHTSLVSLAIEAADRLIEGLDAKSEAK